MHRNAVALIWAAGIAVAVIAYATDPALLLDRALDRLAAAIAAAQMFIADLSVFGSNIVRALALGLFAVFIALAILTIRRGGKARMALFTVSAMFVFLLRDGPATPNGNWIGAFALAAIGALVMTTRVRRGPL